MRLQSREHGGAVSDAVPWSEPDREAFVFWLIDRAGPVAVGGGGKGGGGRGGRGGWRGMTEFAASARRQVDKCGGLAWPSSAFLPEFADRCPGFLPTTTSSSAEPASCYRSAHVVPGSICLMLIHTQTRRVVQSHPRILSRSLSRPRIPAFWSGRLHRRIQRYGSRGYDSGPHEEALGSSNPAMGLLPGDRSMCPRGGFDIRSYIWCRNWSFVFVAMDLFERRNTAHQKEDLEQLGDHHMVVVDEPRILNVKQNDVPLLPNSPLTLSTRHTDHFTILTTNQTSLDMCLSFERGVTTLVQGRRMAKGGYGRRR